MGGSGDGIWSAFNEVREQADELVPSLMPIAGAKERE
jgi:hypothetical protein